MEKERFLVEVTVKGEKDWKAIHMCGSMADAVPVPIELKAENDFKLTKEQLLKYPDLKTITIKIEEA